MSRSVAVGELLCAISCKMQVNIVEAFCECSQFLQRWCTDVVPAIYRTVHALVPVPQDRLANVPPPLLR